MEKPRRDGHWEAKKVPGGMDTVMAQEGLVMFDGLIWLVCSCFDVIALFFSVLAFNIFNLLCTVLCSLLFHAFPIFCSHPVLRKTVRIPTFGRNRESLDPRFDSK